MLSVHLLEDSVTAQLDEVGLKEGEELVKILKRQLAVHQLLLRAETTYRLIFGSQIAALKFLHTNGDTSLEDLALSYGAATEVYQGSFEHYSQDDWTNYLINQELMVRRPENGKYHITIWGRDFLEWIVSTGVTDAKRF